MNMYNNGPIDVADIYAAVNIGQFLNFPIMEK